MKVAVATLFAALSLSLSAAAFAEETGRDCSKSPHPEKCQAVKEAEAVCKGKPTQEARWACVKQKLKPAEAPATPAEAPAKPAEAATKPAEAPKK